MISPRIRGSLVLGLLLAAASLHGQSTPEGSSPTAGEDRESQIAGAIGIRYGAPLGASLYVGATIGRQTDGVYGGPSIIAEAGQDGMRLGLGLASISLGGTYRAQVSTIRTWGNHGEVRADQTYVGPEIQVGLLAGVTVGHYWRISDGGGPARFYAIGSFIGF